jgi:hypothetical protein
VARLSAPGEGPRRTLRAALLAALFLAVPAAAQAPAVPQLLTFPDTASVRVEWRLADAGPLAGHAVRATIVPAEGGAPLWSGELGRLAVDADGTGRLSATVDGVHPRLWSPDSPSLYRLRLEAGGARDSVRFGFRRVEERDGRILLNGRPVFLRGNAINPPGRTLPDSLDEDPRFARDYVAYLKRVGVNVIRLTRTSQAWLDACDELGMMLYQGNYGTPRGGSASAPPDVPLEESLRWYREQVLAPLANHPSVVIYVLANEQASDEIPYKSRGAGPWQAFLTSAYDALRRWDPTRLYIGNAGYGFGRSGDLCDIHRYWGWYYNSFLSFYTLRDPAVCWRSGRVQPITLTENPGNYTGVDGRFNLVPGTKQPASQLNWTGHAPEREQAPRALAYQAWMAGQAIEITRRIRERNPYLAGLMPFTIAFHHWWDVGDFDDMVPKPVLRQYAVSFQPVLLSWELWTPQVYAGTTLRPVAHVVNDAASGESLRGLTLRYRLVDADGTVRLEGGHALPDVPYYAASGTPLALPLPAALPTGRYSLRGWLLRGADTLSHNEAPLFVAERGYAGSAASGGRRLAVYDPVGGTRRALGRVGVEFSEIRTLVGLDAERDALLVGAAAWDDALRRGIPALKAFVEAGGRVLVLRQDAARFDVSWLPGRVELLTEPLDHPLVFPPGRPYRNAMAVNPERPGHPALRGIDRDRLFLWSDFTGWDESRTGFPQVYPVTAGFVLADSAAVARTAILADYGHGLAGVALAEMFAGRGSVTLSAFDLVDRAGLDPVADRLLVNLVRYQTSADPHPLHPLVDSPIVWGDYETERGLVVGVYSGLLLNSVPVVPEGLRARFPVRVTPEGWQLAGGPGGWNTKPAVQYVAHGRRPFGPFGYTSGGSERIAGDPEAPGTGGFRARLPAGRTRMRTTVRNPAAEPATLEIGLNGSTRRTRVPAGATIEVSTPLHDGATDVAVTYRGDRRLVLLRTEFR